MMAKKKHGNSHENEGEHHLYEIYDEKRKGVYKYGISGKPLNQDRTSPRANEQVRYLNRAVGWCRYIANILKTCIAGRLKAEMLEREYIEAFLKEKGYRPPGNLK